MATGLRCLVQAYPEQRLRASANQLHWPDGSVMVYDEGRVKRTLAETLKDADLQDQMKVAYPTGPAGPPARDFDPGRARNAAFFSKMYGASAKQVRRKLATVRWLPSVHNTAVRVSTVNGVHRALAAVSAEVDKLPAAIKAQVGRTAGTFNWRRIQGTRRLSSHSHAIAIDVGVRQSDYWRWHKPLADGSLRWRNRIPMQVVAIFERHGFIWGGRWYHFDTMHFEYRPELLRRPCGGGPTASAGRPTRR